jgi:Pyruvate/2-oxoacid:ferredoxin oxidoreductase gamma subunit
MAGRSLTIRMGGDEGEGAIRGGEILAAALHREERLVLLYRGRPPVPRAPETILLRTGEGPLLSWIDTLDILFVWSQDAYDRYRDGLWPEGLLLYDPDRVRPREADAPIRHGVPLTRLVAKLGFPGAKPYLAAGVLGRLFGLSREALEGEAAASAEDVDAARAACAAGYEHARRPPLGVVNFELEPWNAAGRALRSGAAATAQALVAAGIGTIICAGEARDHEIAGELRRARLRVVEGEDEERALELALDAASAGEPVALLSEEGLGGLGALVGQAEARPVVFLRAPRPELLGPEEDLGAWCGPPARGLLLAPATVEECATISGHAVRYAARFRAPVGLYLDPVLAETLEAIPVGVVSNYEGLTDLPLASATEALSHRWSEVHLPPGARIGIVAWAGTRGAVRDASLVAENLRVRLAHLHPRMLAPAPDGELRSFLGSVERLLVAEPEPSAPLATYLETRFGAAPERLVWPVGSPLTPEAVLRALGLPG